MPFQLRLKTQRDVPMCKLRGYKLREIFHGGGEIAIERQGIELPEIAAERNPTPL